MNNERLASEASEPARIVIAEDHPVFREALRHIVSREAELEVVGEAVDGVDALERCRSLQPDLVLMDLGMPRMNGLEATRKIKREFPRTIVLVLTASVEIGSLSDAIKVGAAGYILKDASAQEIVEAIRRVLRGESSLDHALAMQLLLRHMDEEPTVYTAPPPALQSLTKESVPASPRAESLTARELEVLELITHGRSNREIAQTLSVALTTVKGHVHKIITKLAVSDRTQAAVRAIELGLFTQSKK